MQFVHVWHSVPLQPLFKQEQFIHILFNFILTNLSARVADSTACNVCVYRLSSTVTIIAQLQYNAIGKCYNVAIIILCRYYNLCVSGAQFIISVRDLWTGDLADTACGRDMVRL